MNFELLAAVDSIIKLEKRLIAVTEQRDGIEAKLRIELRGHPDSELWGEAGLIAATMRCVDAINEVTEQRDELAEDRAKWIEYAERGLMKIDAQAERIRYLEGATNHANGTPLTKAIEQRDRMAELLSDIYNYAKGKKPHDYHHLIGSSYQLTAKFDAWQEIECKIEQLLQTTTTQPEPK